QRDATRQRLEREGFREARHALQQDVPVGEQRDQQAVQKVPLTHDDPCHLLLQRADPNRALRDRLACCAHRRIQRQERRNGLFGRGGGLIPHVLLLERRGGLSDT